MGDLILLKSIGKNIRPENQVARTAISAKMQGSARGTHFITGLRITTLIWRR